MKAEIMEQSNKVERSELWHNIYEVLARLDLKEVEGDCLDRSSAATEIEQAVKKLLPMHNINESLPDFTDNDVDGAYFLGVFNSSGIDGLSKELKRVKELGLKPHQFLHLLKNKDNDE